MSKDSIALRDERELEWPKGLFRRRSSFRFRRMVGGKLFVEVMGDIPEGDAIRKAQRYNLDLDDGHLPIDERAKRTMTVAFFIREIWLKKKSAELRPKSLARYRSVMDHFLDYLKDNRRVLLIDISYHVAADYISHRATAPMMPNGQKKFTRTLCHGASKKTLHFEREVLFSAFKEAVKRELIRRNPFEDVHTKKPTIHEVVSAHHPLTIEEEAALLIASEELDRTRVDTENPRFHDIVLFLVRTGLREDELRQLEWSDIDWKDGLIRIRQKQVTETRSVGIPESAVAGLRKRLVGKAPDDTLMRDDEEITAFGARLCIRGKRDMLAIKAGEVDLNARKIVTSRTYIWKPKGTNGVVPMCAAVKNLLLKLAEKKTNNFVFAHKDGGSCRIDLLAFLKVAQKTAGIGGRLRIHDLRHTLGVRLRRDKGVPLETIMGILRHSDLQETLIYAPYSLTEGRSAMGKLDEASPVLTTPVSPIPA